MTEPVRRPWPCLLVVLFAAFMDMMDLGIVSVAAPSIQRDLHSDYASAQWFMASYALAFAVLLIPGGRLGDIYGRKRVFMTAVAGFTVVSVICALAPTAGVLIGARFVQGGFGALMVPQVLAVLQVLFPATRRGMALAAYGTVMNLAQLGGPILGGIMATDNLLGLGWRAIFLVNVPIGALVLAGTAILLPESRSDRPLRLDVVGIVLVALLAGLVSYPLQQGRGAGWPPWMLAALAAALPAGLFFAWHQHRRGPAAALVPVALFRRRAFVAGIVLLLLVYTALLAQQMVVIWHTQIGLGWSPLRTGAASAGWVLGLFLLGGFAVALAPRLGRALLISGCLLVAAAIGVLSEVISHDALGFWQLFGCMTALGCGLGLVVPILVDLVLAGVPKRDAGGGSGVANAVIYFASAVGIGLSGLIFFGQVAAGGDAHARAQEYRVRDAGAGADDALRACVHDRAGAADPYRIPASCRTPQAADPVVASAAAEALRQDFADSAAGSLWYPAGAFLAAVALTPLLPRGSGADAAGAANPTGARPESDPAGPRVDVPLS
ncbi:MFS transporter [Streptomyces sp. H10-C2]|uniref:MFS transporter n=1 Tax=unclassified Streptomyces TaxID=2593676 RepID=UPI0024B96AFD|nr:MULTISPECIES: MFS transporter [unclassified Streptomyces]MDJ0345993.1 MFS transporter [Streptomyces sp. PH10-H1]MDJ0370500.1 MFS transporter [Streptomyces sp. H10-C2]